MNKYLVKINYNSKSLQDNSCEVDSEIIEADNKDEAKLEMIRHLYPKGIIFDLYGKKVSKKLFMGYMSVIDITERNTDSMRNFKVISDFSTTDILTSKDIFVKKGIEITKESTIYPNKTDNFIYYFYEGNIDRKFTISNEKLFNHCKYIHQKPIPLRKENSKVMKAIKIGDTYIIPQIGFTLEYTSFDMGNSYPGIIKEGKLTHRIIIIVSNREFVYDFNSRENSFRFISDVIDGFNIENIIDPYDEKYNQ